MIAQDLINTMNEQFNTSDQPVFVSVQGVLIEAKSVVMQTSVAGDIVVIKTEQ